MKRPKRLVILSDLHSGHNLGLCHPDFQKDIKYKFKATAERLWDWYYSEIRKLAPVDVCLVNGDALNGNGGGNQFWATESFTRDRFEQVDIAEAAIREVKASALIFTIGTSCHVGSGAEDWEVPIAKCFGASIAAQQDFKLNNTVIHAKHDIRGSILSALAVEIRCNQEWAEQRIRPRADLIIRSHVHRYRKIEDSRTTALTTPALELWDTKHGQRNLSGTADCGFIHIDIGDRGPDDFRIHKHINNSLLRSDLKQF